MEDSDVNSKAHQKTIQKGMKPTIGKTMDEQTGINRSLHDRVLLQAE
jgi:hypothetical protein